MEKHEFEYRRRAAGRRPRGGRRGRLGRPRGAARTRRRQAAPRCVSRPRSMATAGSGKPSSTASSTGRRRADAAGGRSIEINDFGATPGVVGMRIAQAFGAIGAVAGAQS